MGKSVFKNTIFNTCYKALNVLFPLITSVYVSHVLGPSGVGRVAYAQNIISYFLIVASVGIPTYGIREIARNSNDINKRSKSFFELYYINFITTFVSVIVFVGLVFFIPKFYNNKALFICVGISLFLNFFNIDWFYSGLEEFVYISVRSIIIKILALISLFVFVRSKDDIIIYALISSLGISLNYILNVFNIKNKIIIKKYDINLKKHIKPVAILFLTMLATDLYNQIDITMMGSSCTDEEIGYYSYAIKLIRIVISVSTAISVTMLPRMSKLFNDKKMDDLQSFANKVMSSVLLLVVPCTIGVFMCSKYIVLVLFGKAFLRTSYLTKMLSPIVFIISISYMCGSITLTAINKEKYLLYATISGAIVNIILNYFLIPIYQGSGAAVASVLAETTVFVLHYCFCSKQIKYHFVTRDNIISLFGGILMGGILFAVNSIMISPILHLIISVLLGAITYFLIIIILKHGVCIELLRRIKNRIIKNNS